MGRRGKIAILLVSFMMLMPMTSWAAKPIKLFIAGTSGAEDTQSMGHFEFAKRLASASDGVFEAEVKINAVMGETDDVTEQAIQGVPVINATDPGRLAAYVPEYGLIQMPYLLPDHTYLNKIMDTKLYAKWDKAFQEKGLKLVTSNGYSGVRSWVTNFPVRTPADLKGVKIRTIGSDLFVNSVNAMGAIATALPWAETYQGIEQGVVDGCEAQIPGIYSMRFYEVSNHVSLSEHFTLIASIPPYILLVRRDAKRRRRVVIPVLFIRLPAKIKKGTARKAMD